MTASNSSSPLSSEAIIVRNVEMLWLLVNPSQIGFIPLTRPSFNSFCISVTGLKSVESSYYVFKSPIRSDKVLLDDLICL